MTSSRNFKVHFGKIGRTIAYEDVEGEMLFYFDISPAGENNLGKWNLELGGHAFNSKGKDIDISGAASNSRHAFARERVKEYAESCGYIVQIN